MEITLTKQSPTLLEKEKQTPIFLEEDKIKRTIEDAKKTTAEISKDWITVVDFPTIKQGHYRVIIGLPHFFTHRPVLAI